MVLDGIVSMCVHTTGNVLQGGFSQQRDETLFYIYIYIFYIYIRRVAQ